MDNIFGFVFANVVCPSIEELRVPILPVRDLSGINVSCPRGSFSGIWFSEELKEAKLYAYIFEVLGGYTFKKGYGIFEEYVVIFYEMKRKEKKRVSKKEFQTPIAITLTWAVRGLPIYFLNF